MIFFSVKISVIKLGVRLDFVVHLCHQQLEILFVDRHIIISHQKCIKMRNTILVYNAQCLFVNIPIIKSTPLIYDWKDLWSTLHWCNTYWDIVDYDMQHRKVQFDLHVEFSKCYSVLGIPLVYSFVTNWLRPRLHYTGTTLDPWQNCNGSASHWHCSIKSVPLFSSYL